MILDVDAGNSLVKWRIVGEQEVGRANHADFLANVSQFSAIERVRMAAVATGEFAEHCRQAFAALGCELEQAKVQPVQSGVRCGYADVTTLGIDRWLGVVAAWREFQASLLVVSVGTAITLDAVAATGNHLGGYIVPGINLQMQALHQGTARVRPQDQLSESPVWGTSTTSAVNNGLVKMVAAFVDHASRDLDAEHVVFTGGGGDYFFRQSKHACKVLRPALVLDGLAVALP